MIDRSTKLVLVDDHPLLLDGLVTAFKNYKFSSIEKATNGQTAITKIKSFEPQLAILDIELPDMTGFEVIDACKKLGLPTKFIILTSFKERAFILKAKKLNISGYLLKDESF